MLSILDYTRRESFFYWFFDRFSLQCYDTRMISYLEGHIKYISDLSVTLLVGGVGYQVFMTQRALRAAQIGAPMQVFIHDHVREDEITLYGFDAHDELELFNICISISGIGPKAGVKILDLGSAQEIKQAIVREDVTFLTRVSGLGKKKAQRLIVEAKSKVEALGVSASPLTLSVGGRSGDTSTGDALSALIGLGYKEYEIREMLHQLPDTAITAEEKVRAALKLLGQHV